MNTTNYYKISELSRISETSVPTIRFYLREGLLPPAVKTGKTTAYYTDDHIARLQLIRKLQTEEQKSLASIKEDLDRLPISALPEDKTTIVSSEKRNVIVSAAIELFVNKGLGETSIDDIVNNARIGKGTFYKYFKDKNDLFFQCADSVFFEMYSHVWKEIKDERDMTRRLFKRGEAFFDSYPKWVDMMNIVRHASVGSDLFFKNKFREILDQIMRPIARDIEILQQDGKIDADLDCLGMAYLLLGMTEYSAWLGYNSNYNTEEIISTLQDLINNGIGMIE
jgi:AcrR family transcriptional regulator